MWQKGGRGRGEEYLPPRPMRRRAKPTQRRMGVASEVSV